MKSGLTTRIWNRWNALAFTTVIVICLAFLFVLSIERRRSAHNGTVQIEAAQSVTANVTNTLRLCEMTVQFGACGRHCGILGGYDKIDFTDVCPEIGEYHRERDAVIWCYNFVPTQVSRKEGSLLLVGRDVSNNNLYLVVVPKKLTDGLTQLQADTVDWH